MSRRTPPRLLTIAGSDSGGGAGIQADLKTFAAHGSYGMSVVTAVTAQNTLGVDAVHVVPPAIVAAQIDAVLGDLGADAVKIGMLATAEGARAVGERLRVHRPPHIVLDPVMVAQSGDPLLAEDAVAALVEEVLPLAEVVTPNLPEAARLIGAEEAALAALLAADDPSAREVAPEIAATLDAARSLGGAVLLKGGHAEGPGVVDLLLEAETVFRMVHPRRATRSNHGTGCTLSSAVAARLGAGAPLLDAVHGAVDYLQGALAAAYPLGRGHGPVDHLYRLHSVERPADA
ncbi:MAG: bifunctional hydroxymethylpyrimidine kinase/phosphomethylpyrimidine kinase [Acidobacteriota bacterium]